MVTWVEAVKEYAKQKGKFVIPKKDSDEYKAVRALQEKMNKAPLPKQEVVKEEKPKRSRKAVVTAEPSDCKSSGKEEKTPVEAVAPVKPKKKVAVESSQVESPIEVKEKKPRAKKAVAVAVVEEPKNEVVEAPVKEKKPRKTALRGEPKVTIENKKVILNFD